MKFDVRWFLSLALFLGISTEALSDIQPPVAPKNPFSVTLHGDTRVDDYHWMLTYPGDKHPQQLLDYLNAENTYTNEKTKHIELFRQKLLQEMSAKTSAAQPSVPEKFGKYLYYGRIEKGKEYQTIYRMEIGSNQEELILDCNELAKGKDYFIFLSYQLSPDGTKFAYTFLLTGSASSLYVKDLTTGQTEKIIQDDLAWGKFAWGADSRALTFVTMDSEKRGYRVSTHTLGANSSQDRLVYEEKDNLFEVTDLKNTHDGKYILLEITSKSTSEIRYLPSDQLGGNPQIFSPRKKDHIYSVEHQDGQFYVLSNYLSVRGGVYKASLAKTSVENWQPLISPSSDRSIVGMYSFKNYLVLLTRVNGLPQVSVFNLKTQRLAEVQFDEPVYEVQVRPWSGLPTNLEYDSQNFVFSYYSLTTPNRVYRYNFETQKKEIAYDDTQGSLSSQNFEVHRFFIPARDGVQVPVSLIYKKGVTLDGSAPLFLNAYGSYGDNFSINYVHGYTTSSMAPLLDRGVIVAIAFVRGGGEMGPQWYLDGKLMKKKNTFNDFIDTAEYLVKQKYSSPQKIGIRSYSAGGLLVGYVINNRPDLFKAAIAHAPFVDLLNTGLDEKIPLTTQEWGDWGNPNLPEDYFYMKSYCPYTNIGHHDYPALLVKSSLDDNQVMVHEPTKFVAKLRTLKTDNNDLLLKVNMTGGHGGKSGQQGELEDVSFDLAWILDQLGIKQ